MHIGYISIESPLDYSRGGGIAAYLRAIIPELVRTGHRITVMANARNRGIQYSYDGALKVVHIRLPPLHWYLSRLPVPSRTLVLPLRQIEWSLKFYAVSRRVFQDDPVDIMESPETGALFLAWRSLAPLVIRLHGNEYLFRKHTGESLHRGVRWDHGLENYVLRCAHAVTSPSHFQAKEVAQELGCKESHIRVIPNPIAPELFAEAEQGWRVAKDSQSTPMILYTGRLAPVKGLRPLMQAVDQVQRAFHQVNFVLAGPWQMAEDPESWGLAKNGARQRPGVVWLGHLPWHKLMQWYRRAALFVMPSYYETFGISCLEAMAFGLPVVATKAGGLPEVIEDGVTGILVPPGDPKSLGEAITRLLSDRDLRLQMGRAGREKVVSEFKVDQVAEKTLDVYKEVLRKS